MVSRLQIKSTVVLIPMSASPFEAEMVWDDGAKKYTSTQAVNAAGVPLWRARQQVVRLGGEGVTANVELAAQEAPQLEALKPYQLQDATITVWSDRRSGGLGLKISAEVKR